MKNIIQIRADIEKERREVLNYINSSNDRWKWSLEVKSKYKYKCAICNSIDRIEAHHLDALTYLVEVHNINMNNFEQQRDIVFDIKNGIALCNDHHDQYHSWCATVNKIPTKASFKRWYIDCELQKDENKKRVMDFILLQLCLQKEQIPWDFLKEMITLLGKGVGIIGFDFQSGFDDGRPYIKRIEKKIYLDKTDIQ